MLRVLRCGGAVALAGFFLLPLSSAFVRADVPLGQKLAFGLVGISAAVSPAAGIGILALFLPFALGFHSWFIGLPPTSVAECLVLACLSGAALRVGWPAEGHGRLGRPAGILAAAAVTSAVVDLAVLRAVAPARPFFMDLWGHLTITYWTEDAGNWLVVHEAFRWCAVLSLAVFVERAARLHADHRRILTWAWIGSAAAASTFTVIRTAEIVARREAPVLESLWWLVTHVRLSVLNPDPNASGSLFAFLLVTALVIGLRRRAWWMLLLIVPMLVVGFGLAQSRAAIGAVIVVLGARWLLERIRRQRFVVPALVVTVAVAGIAAVWMGTSRSHASPIKALELRVQMVQVGVRMAERFPAFGVGLADYARTSRRFIDPELAALAKFAPAGENAHNNYLQVLVELGVVAGVAFSWLVVWPAIAVWQPIPGSKSPEYEGLALGLSAFLVSAVFGHPLLIPEVASMFFLGLGLTASYLEAPRSRSGWERTALWAGVAFYVVSLMWRVRL